MKDFFLDIWCAIKHSLIFSFRGAIWASVILLFTVFIDSMMPREIAFFSNYISLEPYRSALYAIGGIYAMQTFITTWVKDYRREYLPRWLLG